MSLEADHIVSKQEFFDDCPENILKMFMRFLGRGDLLDSKFPTAVTDRFYSALEEEEKQRIIDYQDVISLLNNDKKAFYNVLLVTSVLAKNEYIKTLHLGSNNLECIPNLQMKTLFILGLSNNKFKGLHDFNGMPNLRYLDAGENDLEDIPNFSGLPELEVLVVRKNHLKTLPNFNYASKIKIIDASENNLKNIPNFKYARVIEQLLLYKNCLKHIPSDLNVDMLKKLDVSKNELTEDQLHKLREKISIECNMKNCELKLIDKIKKE